MDLNKMKKTDLIKEVESLREKVEGLKREAKDAVTHDQEYKAEITRLKEEVAAKTDDVVRTSKELQTARQKVVSTNDKLNSIRSDAQGMESRIAELTTTNSKLKVWKYVAVGAIIAFLISLCFIVA